VFVGGLLCEPVDPDHTTGVIFFNNVSTLGMCGHGTIGLIASLAHLHRIAPGAHVIETPVGHVTAFLHDDGRVSVANVPSSLALRTNMRSNPGTSPRSWISPAASVRPSNENASPAAGVR
jgi:proline racemase